MAPKNSPLKITNELPCGGRKFLESYQFNVGAIKKIRSNELSLNCRYDTRLARSSGGYEKNIDKHARAVESLKLTRLVQRNRRIIVQNNNRLTKRSTQLYGNLEYETPRCSPEPSQTTTTTVEMKKETGFEDESKDGSIRDDESIPPTEDEDALEEEEEIEKTRVKEEEKQEDEDDDDCLKSVLTVTPGQNTIKRAVILADIFKKQRMASIVDLSKD